MRWESSSTNTGDEIWRCVVTTVNQVSESGMPWHGMENIIVEFGFRWMHLFGCLVFRFHAFIFNSSSLIYISVSLAINSIHKTTIIPPNTSLHNLGKARTDLTCYFPLHHFGLWFTTHHLVSIYYSVIGSHSYSIMSTNVSNSSSSQYLFFTPKTLLVSHTLAFVFGAYSYFSYIQGDLLHLKHLKENLAQEKHNSFVSKTKISLSLLGLTSIAMGMAMKNNKKS